MTDGIFKWMMIHNLEVLYCIKCCKSMPAYCVSLLYYTRIPIYLRTSSKQSDLIKQSFSKVSLTSWYLEQSQLCLDLNVWF